MKNFFYDKFWRYITNIWTIIFIGVVVSDFVYKGEYTYLITPFSLIYGALLSIFVSTKEFSRWYDFHKDKKHPGEVFVILWSVLILTMAILSWFSKNHYSIPSDVISVYIMVLTIFALTQSSKSIRTSIKRFYYEKYNKKRNKAGKQ